MNAPRRHGAVLFITAALCALLVVLTLAFLVAMRADAQATGVVLGQSQARLMLMAACNYVLEAGRIGWGEECYGWVDVRDGMLGPKPNMQRIDDASRFPIGHVARCPMYAWERPPFAISPRDPNPIDTALQADGVTPVDLATFGQPYLAKPDPLPAAGATTYGEWKAGNPSARPESLALGWFRVYRDGPATFVLTCGSGGTYGFKDWAEVDTSSRTRLFFGSQQVFEQLLEAEVRVWYRIEWSPAVAVVPQSNHLTGTDTYAWYGCGASVEQARTSVQPGRDNVCGTIQWVQRLRFPTDTW
jgi:hypothetical protein